MSSTDPLLSVENLRVTFDTDEGTLYAVDGIDFTVDPGETVCIVGESGSGKTVACESITRLISTPPGHIDADEIRYDGRDILGMSAKQLRGIRGRDIAHIFQNPQNALNHVYTVGWQIREAIQSHRDVSKKEARREAIDLLDSVGIPEASSRVDDYPHELSGGQKQRVVIAMAMASQPDLLIADEPTTALDVTIQAQILDLIGDIQEEYGMSVLFITHDLGVVAQIADRVIVMYAGKVMEHGGVYELFEDPSHPYTRALLDCLPGRGTLSSSIGGTLPDPMDPPDGCRFAPRCDYAERACRTGDQPSLHAISSGGTDHSASCIHYGPNGDPAVVKEDAAAEDTGVDVGRTDGGEAQ